MGCVAETPTTTIIINERRMVEDFVHHYATKGIGASKLEVDEERNTLWQHWRITVHGDVKPFPTGFACQSLCGRRFRRPHLTCMFCRQRRIAFKQRATKVSVLIQYFILVKKRSFLKKWLFKKVAVLFEFFAVA